MACMVRVPTEVVKQRMQTGMYSSFLTAIRETASKVDYTIRSEAFASTNMRYFIRLFTAFNRQNDRRVFSASTADSE